MKALKFLLSVCGFLLMAGAPAGAEVTVRWIDTDQPAQATQSQRPSKVEASTSLVLPYYRAELAAGPLGETTLYAVRNNTSSQKAVRVSVFPTVGAPIIFEEVIPAHGVYTDSISSIDGLPSQAGVATGTVLFQALGEGISPATISGDYFRVSTTSASANGGAMVPFENTDCKQWTHRLLEGGGFNAETYISVLALDTGSMSGNVYDEDGIFMGIVSVAFSSAAFELSTDELVLPVDFGSIDWIFDGDGHGLISTTYTANGLFSVGTEAFCIDRISENGGGDGGGDGGGGTEPPPADGTVVFELPGTFLDCRNCGNWQYNMPFDGQRQFSKVVMEFDLYVAGWDPNRFNGFHCIFWLNNGTRWQDMMGYLNSRGTQNRTTFQSNGPLGNPIGVEKYASPGVQPGNNYSVRYEYDTVNKVVLYVIRNADGSVRVADSIPLPSNVGPLRTSYTFAQFGSQPNGAVESRTERWRWSNLRVEYIP